MSLTALTGLYEEARYSEHEITNEQWKSIRHRFKSAGRDHCNGRANSTRPQSKRGSLWAMTHGQSQRYSRIERPQSIVRRTHQHGPGLDSRGAVPAAVRFASFIAYQLANNERGQSMQEDRTFENKFAPPVRSEKKIGNTTFTVNSFFLEQTKDGVVSKIERLIKDDIRKKAAVI